MSFRPFHLKEPIPTCMFRLVRCWGVKGGKLQLGFKYHFYCYQPYNHLEGESESLAWEPFSEFNCVFRIITLQNLFVLPLSCRMAQPILKCLFPISSSPPKKENRKRFHLQKPQENVLGETQRAWQQIKNQRKLYALHVLKWFIFVTPETLECCQH